MALALRLIAPAFVAVLASLGAAPLAAQEPAFTEGRFLVADPAMPDPGFAGSVIYTSSFTGLRDI